MLESFARRNLAANPYSTGRVPASSSRQRSLVSRRPAEPPPVSQPPHSRADVSHSPPPVSRLVLHAGRQGAPPRTSPSADCGRQRARSPKGQEAAGKPPEALGRSTVTWRGASATHAPPPRAWNGAAPPAPAAWPDPGSRTPARCSSVRSISPGSAATEKGLPSTTATSGACTARSLSRDRSSSPGLRRTCLSARAIPVSRAVNRSQSEAELQAEVAHLKVALLHTNARIQQVLAEAKAQQMETERSMARRDMEAPKVSRAVQELAEENSRLRACSTSKWDNAKRLQMALRVLEEQTAERTEELVFAQRKLEEENMRLKREASEVKARLAGWKHLQRRRRRSESPAAASHHSLSTACSFDSFPEDSTAASSVAPAMSEQSSSRESTVATARHSAVIEVTMPSDSMEHHGEGCSSDDAPRLTRSHSQPTLLLLRGGRQARPRLVNAAGISSTLVSAATRIAHGVPRISGMSGAGVYPPGGAGLTTQTRSTEDTSMEDEATPGCSSIDRTACGCESPERRPAPDCPQAPPCSPEVADRTCDPSECGCSGGSDLCNEESLVPDTVRDVQEPSCDHEAGEQPLPRGDHGLVSILGCSGIENASEEESLIPNILQEEASREIASPASVLAHPVPSDPLSPPSPCHADLLATDDQLSVCSEGVPPLVAAETCAVFAADVSVAELSTEPTGALSTCEDRGFNSEAPSHTSEEHQCYNSEEMPNMSQEDMAVLAAESLSTARQRAQAALLKLGFAFEPLGARGSSAEMRLQQQPTQASERAKEALGLLTDGEVAC